MNVDEALKMADSCRNRGGYVGDAESQETLAVEVRRLRELGFDHVDRIVALEAKLTRVSEVFGVLFDRQVNGEKLDAEGVIQSFSEAMIDDR